LPFANTIVNLTMTGAEINAVLEEAITFALDPDDSTSAYPQASGLRPTASSLRAADEYSTQNFTPMVVAPA
jgi:5'-nucleotidase/UDP-sugar diphosphatase